MSLETDLQSVISNTAALNANVQGKISEIDAKVDSSIAQNEQWIQGFYSSPSNDRVEYHQLLLDGGDNSVGRVYEICRFDTSNTDLSYDGRMVFGELIDHNGNWDWRLPDRSRFAVYYTTNQGTSGVPTYELRVEVPLTNFRLELWQGGSDIYLVAIQLNLHRQLEIHYKAAADNSTSVAFIPSTGKRTQSQSMSVSDKTLLAEPTYELYVADRIRQKAFRNVVTGSHTATDRYYKIATVRGGFNTSAKIEIFDGTQGYGTNASTGLPTGDQMGGAKLYLHMLNGAGGVNTSRNLAVAGELYGAWKDIVYSPDSYSVRGSIIAVQKEGTSYEWELWLKAGNFTGATVEATCGSFRSIELHEDEWATEVTGPLVYNLTPSLI